MRIARIGEKNSQTVGSSKPTPATIRVALRPIISPSTPPSNDPMGVDPHREEAVEGVGYGAGGPGFVSPALFVALS
jgi:hypothetical protein